MASLELATVDLSGADDLIGQMTAAIAQLEAVDAETATDVRRDAAVVEAAAHQAKARETEIAAARLRLYAERRLGQLFDAQAFRSRQSDRDIADVIEFSASQVRDFRRLSAIPTHWYDRWLQRHSDVFVDAVEDQLNDKSHTPYSVWLRSLTLAAHRHSDLPWLSSCWDKSWQIWYLDPRSHRHRRTRFEGTVDEAKIEYARLSGRIKSSSTALLPIRGADPLAVSLDQVRAAREHLAATWPNLSREQKDTLDGAYSQLDDLATRLVAAINL